MTNMKEDFEYYKKIIKKRVKKRRRRKIILCFFYAGIGLVLISGVYLARNNLDSVGTISLETIEETAVEVEIMEEETAVEVEIMEEEAAVETEKISEKQPINQRIFMLREQYGNDDIIGHLNIAGTTINYPVVQYDDNDFYLEHDVWKRPYRGGWIFLDYLNNVEVMDRNTLIYGHNMINNYRFHSLRFYKCKEFLENHSIIIFDTIYGEFKWEVFIFFETSIEFQYIKIYSDNSFEWRELLSQMRENPLECTGISMRIDTGMPVTGEDRVLFLSTCPSSMDEMKRYVVGAKLITSIQ